MWSIGWERFDKVTTYHSLFLVDDSYGTHNSNAGHWFPARVQAEVLALDWLSPQAVTALGDTGGEAVALAPRALVEGAENNTLLEVGAY
jgi:hypothetical protein